MFIPISFKQYSRDLLDAFLIVWHSITQCLPTDNVDWPQASIDQPNNQGFLEANWHSIKCRGLLPQIRKWMHRLAFESTSHIRQIASMNLFKLTKGTWLLIFNKFEKNSNCRISSNPHPIARMSEDFDISKMRCLKKCEVLFWIFQISKALPTNE